MRRYVVRQGDYLVQLASRFGFDPDAVWQHASNRDLRQLRSSPNELAPGDVLYIPDTPASSVSVTGGTHNSYRGTPRRVPIRLRLDFGDQPLANEPCRVTGATAPIEAQTDGEGLLSFEVAPGVREVDVEVVQRGLRFRALIGHLDPHDVESGAVERLVNLGFLRPEARYADPATRRESVRRALAAFQTAQGIEATGELDASTTAELRDHHRR